MIEGFEYQQWLKKSLTRRMLSNLAKAAGTFLLALVVCWLTWWAVYYIGWFALLTLEPSSTVLLAITWIGFGLLVVAYVVANRDRVEQQEFESPAKVRAKRALAVLTDTPWQTLTGPKSAGTFLRVITAVATVGPAMLASSWKFLKQAGAARRASTDTVGAMLATLAHAGTRVALEELFRLDPSDRWETTFRTVRLFDGVIVRTSEPIGLAVNDQLRNEVLKTAPEVTKRSQPAKPPPIRVSSKGQPAVTPARPQSRPGAAISPPTASQPSVARKPGPPAAGLPPAQKSTPPAPKQPPVPKPRRKPPE